MPEEFKARYSVGEDLVKKLLLKSGKLTNCCCETSDLELVITYDWGFNFTPTNKFDLDTATKTQTPWVFSGEEVHGYDCSNIQSYMEWVAHEGSSPEGDDTRKNGYEQVNVKAMTALNASEWPSPSSLNVDLYAWWYPIDGTEYLGEDDFEVQTGGGNILITATYGASTVTKEVYIADRRTSEDPPYCVSDIVNSISSCATVTITSGGIVSIL